MAVMTLRTRLWRGYGLGTMTLTCLLITLLAARTVEAKEIFVNNQTGSDESPGTAQSPLRAARRAVQMAAEGDIIHLLPEGAVYREMISLVDKKGFTIEGHNCTVTAADELPSDSSAWEKLGEGLHRIQLKRTSEDRHLLVVDGKAVTMGRTKYMIGNIRGIERSKGWEAARKTLMDQYPKPQELKDGQFAWEPIDSGSGWLYVKGPLTKLQWSVRTQGIYTSGNVHNITIRNLNVRHALNDGFNFHGSAQNIRLYHVTAHECFDNGISPHGACSFTVEDSQFLRNEMAVGNDFLTETRFLRCTIGESVQEEVMIIGGRHLFEDCLIRATGPNGVRLIYTKRNQAFVLNEVKMSGKDPDMKPQYTFRNCTVESADGKGHAFIVGPGVNLITQKCTFKGIEFQVDATANVQVANSTLDGKALSRMDFAVTNSNKPAASPAPAGTQSAPPATQPSDTPTTQAQEPIDFTRARELMTKRQRGTKLTAEEESYLQRAIEARRRGARPGREKSSAPTRDMTGIKPLTEMTAEDRYQGEDGGLYDKGSNTPPETHRKAAEAELARIQPRDAQGKPAKDGKIVLVSISMSNATQSLAKSQAAMGLHGQAPAARTYRCMPAVRRASAKILARQ